jgi:hypothetical protein
MVVTFGLVLVGWVLFRADSLGHAWRYLAHMSGIGEPAPATALATPVMLQPFLLLTLMLAAFITWRAPQSIDWSAHLSTWRASTVACLLMLTLAWLATQSYNPFIYFIF